MTTPKKQTPPNAEPQVADNAPNGLALDASEQQEARKEGAKEDVKDAAKEAHRFLTDGQLPGAPPARQYFGADEIQQFAGLLDLSPDAFAERVAEDAEPPVPEEKIAGLLGLERGGRNRTLYVKPLMERLGVKSPYEVTDAGPAYTNDQTAVTPL